MSQQSLPAVLKGKERRLVARVQEIDATPARTPVEWEDERAERREAIEWLLERLTQRYASEVDMFFRGEPMPDASRERGKVRVVEHDTMQTLQVEPPEGGQYEIAVRVPIPPSHTAENGYHIEPGDKYQGYVACANYMWGRNTGGH